MAFCQKCGAQLPDGSTFCPACGAQTAAAQGGAQQGRQQYQHAAAQGGTQQPPYPRQPPPQNDAEANKVMAILSYIIFFVPLLTGAHKTSPFVKYHANQGTVLFLLALAWGIINALLTGILTAILINPATWYSASWGVYGTVITVLNVLWLLPTALCIYGIVNAATGKQKPLPVVGRFTIIR